MIIKKFPWLIIKQCIAIIFGAFVVAISINVFILPNQIADGGITGIAIILYYLLEWEVGLLVFILNIPLFILGYKEVGRQLFFLSILGVASFSIALRLTEDIFIITTDSLLAAIFGGLVTGIGMGIIFRSRGSMGGTDILAIVLNRKTQFSVGQIILGLDAIVFLGAALIFEPEMAMYAMIYMFIASKMIDLVQVGLDYSKSVMIITDQSEQIAGEIIKKLERGVTYFVAEGAYSQSQKKVVYSIINRAQLTQLKEIVHRNDPQAFMAIGDVSEVVGEGFSSWKGH